MSGLVPALFDVVAINLRTKAERILDRDLTRENAEAVVRFTVVRRGCDVEFYVVRPTWASL